MELISVAMQPILADHNISCMDVECEEEASRAQPGAVSGGPVPGRRLQILSVPGAHRGGSSVVRNRPQGRFSGMACLLEPELEQLQLSLYQTLFKNKGTWGMQATRLAWCCRWSRVLRSHSLDGVLPVKWGT